MALTDSGDSLPRPLPAASGSLNDTSRRALSRLPQIHAESAETTSLAHFLRAAVPAAGILTVSGGAALALAGGAGLQQEFAWSALVLLGVAAMVRSYIKSVAQAFDRAPLRESAKDLRAIFFYAGFAWGAGAFLLLGGNPVPVTGLCFAVLPCALLAPLIKDRAAIRNFAAPVTALTAVAIMVQPWGDAPVALALLVVLQGGLALAFSGRTKSAIPAGLSLR